MTNISPTSSVSLGRIEPASTVSVEAREAPKAPARRGADRVEVSEMARLLGTLKQMPDVRADLVERVRGEIAAGRYETDEKLEIAIDLMIDDAEQI